MKSINVKILTNTANNKIQLLRFLNDELYHFPELEKDIIIPAGFETDLASVPTWLWSIFSPSDQRSRDASIIHDYLYINRKELENKYGLTRKKADKIFLQVMIKDRMPLVKAYCMYLGVRIGGKKWYNKY